MRLPILAAGAILLATSSMPARADPLSDCERGRDAQARLEACNSIIVSATYGPGQRAIAYRNRGELRLRAGASDQAILDYSAALAILPDDVPSYAGRARAWLANGNLDGAVADFNAALERQPRSATLLIGRGHTLMLEGQFDAAIADLTEAIRINPKSASAFNHRGLAYRRQGDTKRAVEDYTAAIALNPVYALAYSNRGHAYESLGRKEEAIADFSRALLLDGSIVSASEALKRLGAGGTLAADSERRIREGRALAESTCSFCHAIGRTGASPNPNAPEFRSLEQRHPELALREPLSRAIAAPHDVMPSFTLSEEDVDALIAYINSL